MKPFLLSSSVHNFQLKTITRVNQVILITFLQTTAVTQSRKLIFFSTLNAIKVIDLEMQKHNVFYIEIFENSLKQIYFIFLFHILLKWSLQTENQKGISNRKGSAVVAYVAQLNASKRSSPNFTSSINQMKIN